MLCKMVSYTVYAVHDVLHMGYYPLRHNVQSGLNFINATRVMTKSLLGAQFFTILCTDTRGMFIPTQHFKIQLYPVSMCRSWPFFRVKGQDHVKYVPSQGPQLI